MREFIEKMRKRDLVIDIDEPVSAEMQAPKMAATTDKLLFFHNIGGGRAVMNLTASRASLSVALGIDERQIVKTLADAKFDGKVVQDGTLPMKKPDLSRLPIMHHFPKDAGKYLTSAIVFSRFDGVENASIHRMLVLDDHRVAARLVEGRHTHVMLKKALAEGGKLPIAVTIGTHPAVTFASCTRVPTGMELGYAAELLGGEIRYGSAATGCLCPMRRSCSKGSSAPISRTKGRLSISPGPTILSGASPSSSSAVCTRKRTSSIMVSCPGETSIKC